MKHILPILTIICVITALSCSSESVVDNTLDDTLYFPPVGSNTWNTITFSELDWNESELAPLLTFLKNNGSKAFILLKNGKIVVENYFDGHSESSNWYWASAGKTLTAFTLGIAQYEGYLNINDPSATYLGNGWSNLNAAQENQITIKHHLTMTTGLDYTVDDIHCTDAECLNYLNPPGEFWYYHNAPYTILQPMISGALSLDFDTYFNEKVRNPIGMQGNWLQVGYNRLFLSTARNMARFGLLCLNNGVWDGQEIMPDNAYFEDMTNTSQNLNEAYGYLWWLNGKNTFRLPGHTTPFSGKLIPNAPDDLIAGLGANDQKLYVVPSQGLVVIRMGNDAGQGQLGPSSFDNLLWEKINALMN